MPSSESSPAFSCSSRTFTGLPFLPYHPPCFSHVTVLSTVSTVAIEFINSIFCLVLLPSSQFVPFSAPFPSVLCSLLPNGLSYRSSCANQYLWSLLICCVCPSRRRQRPWPLVPISVVSPSSTGFLRALHRSRAPSLCSAQAVGLKSCQR